MAIPDQSNYNNIVAVGIQNASGAVGDIASISGGVIPEPIRNQIVNLIDESFELNGGITTEIYNAVAALMLPSTPSLDMGSLVAVLKSNSVFGNISSGSFNVGSIIDDNLNMFINQYELDLLSHVGGIDAILGKFGIGDGLASIVTELTGDVKAVVNGLLGSVLTTPELSEVSPDVVATLLRGNGTINIAEDLPQIAEVADLPAVDALIRASSDDLGNIDLDSLSSQDRDTFAASYVKGASGTTASIGSLTGVMKKTRGTIAGTIDQTQDLPTPNPFPIDADTINPEGSYIASVEELESEMASITRDVSEVVVHWSETYTNSNLSAAQLTELTGAGDNAYHMIIRRDGSVERGLPLNTIGNHCNTLGHNAHSIGVCFVGGLNVSSGSSSLNEVASSRSITLSQYNSFYQIMRTFFVQFPGGQALGHRDIDPNHEDPGFDVRDYVFNNFNKQSMYTDTYQQAALSPDDLLKLLEGTSGNLSPLNKDIDVMEKNF